MAGLLWDALGVDNVMYPHEAVLKHQLFLDCIACMVMTHSYTMAIGTSTVLSHGKTASAQSQRQAGVTVAGVER